MSKVLSFFWNAGATAFWGLMLVLLPVSLFWSNLSDWCGSEQYETFISPNKDVEAEVTIINCGATTNYETQISVHSVNTPEEKDILVVLDGHPNELKYKVSWLDESTIEISEFNFQYLLSFHSRNKVGDVVKSHIRPKNLSSVSR